MIQYLWHLRTKLRPADAPELKLSVILKLLGQNIYGLYEPIILYFLLDSQVIYVLLYYGMDALIGAVFTYWGARWVSRHGIKAGLIWGTIFLVASLGWFALLTVFPWQWSTHAMSIALWLVGYSALFTVYKVVYWQAYHTHLGYSMTTNRYGATTGWLQFVNSLLAVAGPLIGAALLVTFGNTVLITIALLFIICSIVPLQSIYQTNPTTAFSWSGSLKEAFSIHHIRSYLPFWGESIVMYLGIYWSLYVFTNLRTITGLGMIAAGVTLMTGIWGWLLGKLTDRNERTGRKAIIGGVIISAIGWLLKGLFTNPFALFATDTLQKSGHSIIDAPYSAFMYKRYQQKPNYSDEYIIIRETILRLGSGLTLIALAGVLHFFGLNYFGFILGALGTLGYLFI